MEGKLLRSARRFAKPFVAKAMGIVSSAFRMDNKLRCIDRLLLVGVASSWLTTILFVLFDVPLVFIVIWILKSLFMTWIIMEHIKQIDTDYNN